jgi:hypothetical protein
MHALIAAIPTTTLSVLSQRVDIVSQLGAMQPAMVHRGTSVGLLMCRTGTLNTVLEADLTTSNAMGAKAPTHLDLPQTNFENRVGVIPPFAASRISSRRQTRHKRKHSRQHHTDLRGVTWDHGSCELRHAVPVP